MSNAALTSILTRCLLDAAFLDRFDRERAAALAPYRLSERERRELEAIDLERVRRFSGFITKVKHNDLWEHFPYTRLLMKRLGLELTVFTAYRGEHQRLLAEGPRDRRARIAGFLDFLQRYLDDPSGPGFGALSDVARHERFLWEIRFELGQRPGTTAGAPPPEPGERPPADLVPRPRGALRVGRFAHHPLELVAATSERRLDPERLEPRRRWLAYLVEDGPDERERRLEILEIDAATAALLSAVDGRRSLGEIVAAALPGEDAGVREAAARSFYESLCRLGSFGFSARAPKRKARPATA